MWEVFLTLLRQSSTRQGDCLLSQTFIVRINVLKNVNHFRYFRCEGQIRCQVRFTSHSGLPVFACCLTVPTVWWEGQNKQTRKWACCIPSFQVKLSNLSTINLMCPIVSLLPRSPDRPGGIELWAIVHRKWLLQVWVDTSHRSELKHFPSHFVQPPHLICLLCF